MYCQSCADTVDERELAEAIGLRKQRPSCRAVAVGIAALLVAAELECGQGEMDCISYGLRMMALGRELAALLDSPALRICARTSRTRREDGSAVDVRAAGIFIGQGLRVDLQERG